MCENVCCGYACAPSIWKMDHKFYYNSDQQHKAQKLTGCSVHSPYGLNATAMNV